MATAKKKVWPKAMGACADMLYQMRADRLAKKAEVDAMEADEKALKEHIIANLPKSEASGIAGRTARVTVTSDEVPQVKDWDKFYAHILKTKDFAYLNRALNKAHATEVRDNTGKLAPGLEMFDVIKVSCTKV